MNDDPSMVTRLAGIRSRLMGRPVLFAILQCLFSASLLILSHPPYHLWFFSWAALVPLLFALEGRALLQRFWLGYLFGVWYCFGMFWWFIHVTVPGMVLLNLFLAGYFGLFAVTCGLMPGGSLSRRALWTACSWVMWEFARARFLTGFGWAALGHTQYLRIALIQIADIAGVFGVSFLVVVVNYCFYAAAAFMVKRSVDGKQLRRLLTGGFLAVVAVLIYGFWVMIPPETSRGRPLRIALIQPNISQRHKWDPARREDILHQLAILSAEAAKEGPDVIVWPESSLPAAPHGLKADLQHVQSLALEKKIPVMAGYVRVEDGAYYNTAGLVSSDGILKEQYDKLHLVPFGEFVPLRGLFPFLSGVIPIEDMSPGREPVLFVLEESRDSGRVAVLICFEDTVDAVARRMVNAGAEIFLNMTNDAWFHDTKAPWLHLQAAVFQAVSFKRPLVRSANTGVSAAVTSYGDIQEVLRAYDGKATFRAGFLVVEAEPRTQMTWRAKLGDLFAYLCIATLLAGVIINRAFIRGRTG